MTVGEVARYANRHFMDEAKGDASRPRRRRVHGWRRDMLHADTGLHWVMPSPNMPTADTALLYPGTGMFEGTNLSEGRGTTRPFRARRGRPTSTTAGPSASSGRTSPACSSGRRTSPRPSPSTPVPSAAGVQVHITDAAKVDPSGWASRCFRPQGLYPDFAWRQDSWDTARPYWIDKLTGSTRLREMVTAGSRPARSWPRGAPSSPTSSGAVSPCCSTRARVGRALRWPAVGRRAVLASMGGAGVTLLRRRALPRRRGASTGGAASRAPSPRRARPGADRGGPGRDPRVHGAAGANGYPMYPGAVGLMAHRARVVAVEVCGDAVRYGDATTELPRASGSRCAATRSFDLASVSKLFTSIAAVQLVRGGPRRARCAGRVATCPSSPPGGKEGVTVQHLLTHTSGFVAWLPRGSAHPDRAARIAAVMRQPTQDPPGTSTATPTSPHRARRARRAAPGRPSTFVVRDRITRPIGMRSTGYTPRRASRCAATE